MEILLAKCLPLVFFNFLPHFLSHVLSLFKEVIFFSSCKHNNLNPASTEVIRLIIRSCLGRILQFASRWLNIIYFEYFRIPDTFTFLIHRHSMNLLLFDLTLSVNFSWSYSYLIAILRIPNWVVSFSGSGECYCLRGICSLRIMDILEMVAKNGSEIMYMIQYQNRKMFYHFITWLRYIHIN